MSKKNIISTQQIWMNTINKKIQLNSIMNNRNYQTMATQMKIIFINLIYIGKNNMLPMIQSKEKITTQCTNHKI